MTEQAKTSIKIPTISLLKIEPSKILVDLKAGKFNRPIPTKKLIPFQTTKSIIPEIKPGEQCYLKIYNLRDKNGLLKTITPTSMQYFHLLDKQGQFPPKGGICHHPFCAKPFDHDPVGIPLEMKEDRIVDEEDNVKTLYVFWIEGLYHSFECALGHLYLKQGKCYNDRDSLYCSSEQLLFFLFALCFPDQDLKPKNDELITIPFGGGLTTEEAEQHYYIKKPGITLYPVSRNYERSI